MGIQQCSHCSCVPHIFTFKTGGDIGYWLKLCQHLYCYTIHAIVFVQSENYLYSIIQKMSGKREGADLVKWKLGALPLGDFDRTGTVNSVDSTFYRQRLLYPKNYINTCAVM